MDKFALALCGGGGKGAYHIGMWLALDQLGRMDGLEAISGTSVGALNAILIALGEKEKDPADKFKRALSLWESVHMNNILSPKVRIKHGKLALCSRSEIRKWLENDVGIIEIGDKTNLKDCVPIYIYVKNKSKGKIEIKKINDMSKSMIISYLLASSAMSTIYPREKIDRYKYYDAGRTQRANVPVDALGRKEHKNVLVGSLCKTIDLSCIKSGKSETCDFITMYPNTKFTVLKPLTDMGSFVKGTANFHQKRVKVNICRGYIDTMLKFNKDGMDTELFLTDSWEENITTLLEGMPVDIPSNETKKKVIKKYKKEFDQD